MTHSAMSSSAEEITRYSKRMYKGQHFILTLPYTLRAVFVTAELDRRLQPIQSRVAGAWDATTAFTGFIASPNRSERK